MNARTLAGFLALFIALVLQFFFGSIGVYLNLSYAALISFAFVFDFWELIFLVAVAVFIVNWQPAASVEIVIFAAFPIAAYFLRNILRSQAWLADAIAIALGFLTLYLIVSPGHFLGHLPSFLMDLAAGEFFGMLVFFPLYRTSTG